MEMGGWSFFFFQAEDGIRDLTVTGVQTCALPISGPHIQPADIQVVFGNLAQTLDTPKTKVDTVPVPIPDMATAGKVKFTLFNLDTANVSAADSFVITAPAAFDGTVPSLVSPRAIAKFTRGAH